MQQYVTNAAAFKINEQKSELASLQEETKRKK